VWKARKGGNVPRTYAPQTLKHGSKSLVNSSNFTADLTICRFVCLLHVFLPDLYTTVFAGAHKVYTCVFSPPKTSKQISPPHITKQSHLFSRYSSG
uniref:Uncharacterized protein n=1 Tax=Bubo bubo TaxID=30461 RepID=A0A8C0FDD1_BUBBB